MKTILIAEDDPGLQEAFNVIFDGRGYNIVVYAQANAILSGAHVPPDLYILDKQLSGVDGLDVCRYLKSTEATKHIPVIIVSASTHIAKEALNAGCNRFLAKPFKRKELIDIVAALLA